MGCIVLTDTTHERSVLFCTTSERALEHEAFMGPDSAEQAENFLEWLDRDPRALDPRALDMMRFFWQEHSHDGDGEYVGAPAKGAYAVTQ